MKISYSSLSPSGKKFKEPRPLHAHTRAYIARSPLSEAFYNESGIEERGVCFQMKTRFLQITVSYPDTFWKYARTFWKGESELLRIFFANARLPFDGAQKALRQWMYAGSDTESFTETYLA